MPLTAHYQVSIREDSLCLHEHPGMSVMEHVKHSISVDSDWLLRSGLGFIEGQLIRSMTGWPWDVPSDGGGLGERQPTRLVQWR